MTKDKYTLLFFSCAAFFFCASIAFLCYVFFFDAASSWLHILLNQLLSALSLSILISSGMIIIAIIGNKLSPKQTRQPLKSVRDLL
jgi:hypothetical protein